MPPAPLSRSGKSRRTTDSPISYFIQKALETPGLISFAAGLVDEGSLPVEEVGAAVAGIVADPLTGRAALQYGSTQGLPELREQVLQLVCDADGVRPSDVNLTADDVCITTGSQQLLYLLGEVLFDPGDIVITEAPSYFVFHSLLQSHGAKVLTVPLDEHGMRMDALESLLERLRRSGDLARVKVIYTVDYFQNPTGLTLAVDRRAKLVELARQYSTNHRIIVLEDAAYRELRFTGADLPSVKRFDPKNEFVVYTSTFSKPCSPGLKTGYALMPPDVMAPLLHLKGSHDFGSGNLSQHVASRLIASGAYAKHAEHLRNVYRKKRDLMVQALETEFRDFPAARWTVPAGGFYVWLTFDGIDTGPDGPLVPAALEAGVLYVPGQFGHVFDDTDSVPNNECRLCFGVATEDQIPEGIRRLRKACAAISAGKREKVKASV
ncbi:family transcriptional regulator : Transcriptional regulator with HTH domain and aminotransferase domain OS=Singulisphaera acidiphila (strain ATCC BAA-1392 / DSM 18658 / VKM B-2454 / MOB10) GN=Sinac_2242 PE=4 SV=1: Aminotran_1_2 [Gemmata massiliana]|uniref:Aminotransferase class I/classII large domain-containing protein n=1 Tax=Gemmata massiliana TaxID=1210884 RepID=A0A6P2CQS1_9BACT|nr:PLP-dependent aminotransferase family protein [Gemmata massiliana]VTR91209.1 family transcriptional regulator : Transcriptional regulator with HTH domain and aminotransferase domain OS=Singulisphaera acidiphila (strain ATCC BAA-1392 / DSM 18658 / VKM B-2454 / MOB10) GN=Sinac_2242 PE=4 SV=1: Aminotran_1_2 [Gemmata massiliana]